MVLSFPAGWADMERRQVRYPDGQHCELSEREAALLGYLAQHRERVVSRAEILARVWGLKPEKTITRTIDMHIARLRDKLHDEAGPQQVLITVHGQGYRLRPWSVALQNHLWDRRMPRRHSSG
jgi:DNA-binding response OmpR family regulator